MGGFPTLLYKELLRFWKVSFQTVAAPVLTALLYLVVFAYALGDTEAARLMMRAKEELLRVCKWESPVPPRFA